MEALWGDPEVTGTVWVWGSDLLDVFRNEIEILL
jgi:hypothetical protein